MHLDNHWLIMLPPGECWSSEPCHFDSIVSLLARSIGIFLAPYKAHGTKKAHRLNASYEVQVSVFSLSKARPGFTQHESSLLSQA